MLTGVVLMLWCVRRKLPCACRACRFAVCKRKSGQTTSTVVTLAEVSQVQSSELRLPVSVELLNLEPSLASSSSSHRATQRPAACEPQGAANNNLVVPKRLPAPRHTALTAKATAAMAEAVAARKAAELAAIRDPSPPYKRGSSPFVETLSFGEEEVLSPQESLLSGTLLHLSE